MVLLCGCSNSGENTASEDTAPAQEEVQAQDQTQDSPFFIGDWLARTAVVNDSTVDAKDVFGGTFVLNIQGRRRLHNGNRRPAGFTDMDLQ